MDDTVVRRVLVRELMTYSGCHFLSTLSLDLRYLLKVLSHYIVLYGFLRSSKSRIKQKSRGMQLTGQ